MNVFAAILPILIVLTCMLVFRLSGHASGIIGWLSAVVLAFLVFGGNREVLWVSQLKGLLLSINVIAILWPALLLYYLVFQLGGMEAVVEQLQSLIADRGLLLIIIAWLFSGLLEGLAGFGIPLAIVSPLLIVLGVPPIAAVAAAAVGHSWAVTFGSMGIVYQTLVTVVDMEPSLLAVPSALFLGIACLLCGMGSAFILGQQRHWRIVFLLAGLVGIIKVFLVLLNLAVLGSFLASLAGILAVILLGDHKTEPGKGNKLSPQLLSAVIPYGLLAFLIFLTRVFQPVLTYLSKPSWSLNFPAVMTHTGWLTPAAPSLVFQPWIHPGTLMLASLFCCIPLFENILPNWKTRISKVLLSTWKSSFPASLTVLFMVGLSTLMDYSGMTVLIASTFSAGMGRLYPLFSPLVGMLGAFATGSNNNSNVLFAPMQRDIALLLQLSPAIMVAAQTAGGSLGSMIAPVKLAIGCSTTGLTGKDGQVLRLTLPAGLLMGLLMGLITLLVYAIF